MPIVAYLKPGTAFSPEHLSVMSQALEGAVSTLNISTNDGVRQLTVAMTIIRLTQENPGLDAAELLSRTVAVLGSEALS
jgi:hypothetical protein